MTLGWLRAIREEKGFLQLEVAEIVGIKQPTYSNIENGERKPSVAVAKKIANLFNFDWKKFYEEVGQEKQMKEGRKELDG